MKVKICNLGVVEEAEINLKPLTVFIGENGTGKTWTAYTIGSILSSYGYGKYLEAFFDDRMSEVYPPLEEALLQLIKEGNARVNLVDFANFYLEVYINDVANVARNYMPEFMATKRADFKNTKIEFNILDSKQKILDRIKLTHGESKIGINPQNREGLINSFKEKGDKKIYFYTGNGAEIDLSEKLPRKVIFKFIAEPIVECVYRSIYRSVYIFPTERTTLIALPLKKYDLSDLEEEERFLVPLEYLIGMVIQASSVELSKRENEAEKEPEIQKYLELANCLENDILQGEIVFEKSNTKIELLYKTLESFNIELSLSSSLVKELAPLVLYLRCLAQPNDLIVIDEPEMNLHPAAQVEIIEFLAMLVQAGLNVLITTHSPYIVDHLSNLMRAAQYEDKESIRERFYLEQTEAFIPQEQVSVYLFEDGTAKNILSDDGRIDWGTFADVSDDISRILP